MSGSSTGPSTTAKLQPENPSKPDPAAAATPQQQAPQLLEEDDEFEDFPVEDWTQEDTEVPGGTTHLWEESWDDDDEDEDFAKQLRYAFAFPDLFWTNSRAAKC